VPSVPSVNWKTTRGYPVVISGTADPDTQVYLFNTDAINQSNFQSWLESDDPDFDILIAVVDVDSFGKWFYEIAEPLPLSNSATKKEYDVYAIGLDDEFNVSAPGHGTIIYYPDGRDDAGDTLTGDDDNDVYNGLGGHDTIAGNGGDDYVQGGKGNDTITGGSGNDRLYGDDKAGTKTGIDSIDGGGGDDFIDGGAGDDFNLRGGSGNDIIYGGNGIDYLFGDGGEDILNGGSHADLLDGGAGRDIMRGGTGGDTYVVNHIDDKIQETGDDTDTVNASISFKFTSDDIENLNLVEGAGAIDGTGNDVRNVIEGNSSANKLSGLGGNDDLFGNDGKDVLLGGKGRDDLHGGNHKDTLTGGTGADDFYLDDTGACDIITDYRKADGDRIVLELPDFNTTNVTYNPLTGYVMYHNASGQDIKLAFLMNKPLQVVFEDLP
jgi:Ca2+-binding RTX toxin-like protein